MNTFFLSFIGLFVFVQSSFSQGIERKVLRGKIAVDSFDVENVTVFNVSSNVRAVTDIDGKFSIRARPTDTLFFEGTSFVSQKYILTQKDFWKEELEIKLHVKITELDEVVISPYSLTGDLKEDTKRIQVYGEAFVGIDAKAVKYYEDDITSQSPLNIAMPNSFAPGASVDIIAIGTGIGKLLGINRDSKTHSEQVYEERRIRDLQSKSFSEHIFERFSNNFFVETLKIKNEDIPIFMTFSELSIYELSTLLKTENELQLTEYLVNKATEFKLQIPKE